VYERVAAVFIAYRTARRATVVPEARSLGDISFGTISRVIYSTGIAAPLRDEANFWRRCLRDWKPAASFRPIQRIMDATGIAQRIPALDAEAVCNEKSSYRWSKPWLSLSSSASLTRQAILSGWISGRCLMRSPGTCDRRFSADGIQVSASL
jgi:hypothetical protein